LDVAEARAEAAAEQRIAALEAAMPPADPNRGVVLVTGGTGLLGRPVVTELRHAGFNVRVLSRRVPRPSQRIPGVEYLPADLGGGLDVNTMQGVSLVVHCAAETAGGKNEHQRNSIAATRNVIEAAARAGVKKLIHVSSLAVLKPGREVRGPLNEQAPVDADNLGRGPYVWGKAESEVLVQRLGAELGVAVKIVRPGPLVDYTDFHPPGRLGRELGPYYVAIGGRNTPLSVCDVWTAARVIRSYADAFEQAPPMLNMVEGKPPTRKELVTRMLEHRPDLKVIWFPGFLLRLANGPLMLAQRLLLGMKKPVDVYSAFASERYQTDLAHTTIERAGPSAIQS
jgi:nucleoside-diphosphate-sugar epimerase